MNEAPSTQRKTIIIFLAVLIIIVVIVAAVATGAKKKDTTATPESATSETTEPAPAEPTKPDIPAAATDSAYRDGSYTATGSYVSPGGNEKITITVTLKDGVVTDTSATEGAQSREAEEYQGNFIGGYKSQVVGKAIESLQLSRVSGSSLTSRGFNDAIEQIKRQAQS